MHQKRKREGKDSEVLIDGKLIPQKRMKKELGRYGNYKNVFQTLLATAEQAPEGVIVRTPPSTDNDHVISFCIPWFQVRDCIEKIFASQLALPTQPSASITSSSQQQALSLFNALFGHACGKDEINLPNLYGVTSLLEEELPLKQKSNASLQSRNSIRSRPISTFLTHAIYESSNANLRTSKTDNFLNWVVESETVGFIMQVTRLKEPLSQAFASNMLLSAIRTGNESLVRMLLDQGVSPESIGSSTVPLVSKNPLQTAADAQRSEIVQVLLDCGADPNGTGNSRCAPLQLALGGGKWGGASINDIIDRGSSIWDPIDEETAMILIKAGADVTKLFDLLDRFPLSQAARHGNIHLVEAILKATPEAQRSSAMLDQALQSAAFGNNLPVIKLLRGAGANTNFTLAPDDLEMRDWARRRLLEGDTLYLEAFSPPIQIAARQRNQEMVRYLIEQGADVNASTDFGSRSEEILDWIVLYCEGDNRKIMEVYSLTGCLTPLQQAVYDGNFAMADYLLKEGASVGEVGITEWTALQMACMSRSPTRIAVAQLLLDWGADVNAPASHWYGRTALQAAAHTEDANLVSLLLKNDADVNAPAGQKGGRTALQAASETGNEDLVTQLFVHGGDVNAEAAESNGLTCVQAAVSSGNFLLVDMLLILGADINAQSNGKTILQVAIEKGSQPGVERLLQAGAHINRVGGGITPLCTAVLNKDRSMLDLLLENGAVTDHPDCLVTPLLAAIDMDWVEGVQQILRRGANVDSCSMVPIVQGLSSYMDHRNIPPYRFVYEVRVYHDKAFHDLRSRKGGSSPLYRAICHQNPDIVRELIQHGANVDTPCIHRSPIHLAALYGGKRIVQMLLDAKVDINAPPSDSLQMTALQLAISQGHCVVVDMLMDAGASVNAPTGSQTGRTALQAAVERQDISLVEDLISLRADVNAPPAGKYGATALQLAAVGGAFNIAVLLLEEGAQIDAAPARIGGYTALEGAAMNGRIDVLHLLLQNYQGLSSFEMHHQKALEVAESNGQVVVAEVLRNWK
ncbi:ankyrin repeat-containing domain protein [Ilyonectria robusta]|uniref:ankyrin repeat-containing domain protein n=1 Tax=Ilyonectria robusta TaxID=1079257 RepID=UPI001E8E6452|nr:ankyrin repeat-containing domain protein [Ilyonectria robusta]KAH8686472.1 ankyrin repeat-containing domain protein [Ilyonectria robusta]